MVMQPHRRTAHRDPGRGLLRLAGPAARRLARGGRAALVALLGLAASGCGVLLGIDELSSPSSSGSSPPALWHRRFGDTGEQTVAHLVAGAGSVFVTGSYDESIDFGGGALRAAGGPQRFLLELDASTGAHRRSASIGDVSDNPHLAQRLAAAASGLVVGGGFEGRLQLGGQEIASHTPDAFVAQLGGGGELAWSYPFRGSKDAWVADLAVDAAGRIDVIGGFDGTIPPGVDSKGGGDAFVAQFDVANASRGPLAIRPFGTPDEEAGLRIAAAQKGSIVVAVSFSAAPPFGVESTSTSGGVVVAKLDAVWQPIWTRVLDGFNGEIAGIAVDQDDNAIVAGAFSGDLTLDRTLRSTGSFDAFAVKLDPRGAYLWSRQFGGAGSRQVRGLALDAGGNIYLAGQFHGELTADVRLEGTGAMDAVVIELNPAGDPVWSRRIGGIGYATASGVAVRDAGDVVVGIEFAGAVDLGRERVTSVSDKDLLIAALRSGTP